MADKDERKVTPRSADFAAWYNDIILKAELADYSPVRGCIVFRPDGFAIWEALRDELDAQMRADIKKWSEVIARAGIPKQ